MAVESSARTRRSPVGALAVLLTLAGLVTAAGLPGLLVGLGVAVCWYAAPAPFAAALGALGLVALLPADAPLLRALPAGLGLAGVLVAASPATTRRLDFGAAYVVALAPLLVAAWTGWAWGGAVWTGALALAVVAAVLSYGIHRYERLRFGLLEADHG